jgi:hypothetical protein
MAKTKVDKGKPLYAQAVIEEPGADKEPRRWNPGDRVPKSLDDIDALIDGGAVANKKPEED